MISELLNAKPEINDIIHQAHMDSLGEDILRLEQLKKRIPVTHEPYSVATSNAYAMDRAITELQTLYDNGYASVKELVNECRFATSLWYSLTTCITQRDLAKLKEGIKYEKPNRTDGTA